METVYWGYKSLKLNPREKLYDKSFLTKVVWTFIVRLIFSKLPKWLMFRDLVTRLTDVCGSFCTLGTYLELLGILKGNTMAKFLILIARDFTQNWRHWLKMNGKRIVQQSKISKGGGMSGGGRNIPLCNVSGGEEDELTSQAPPNTIEHQLQHHQQ